MWDGNFPMKKKVVRQTNHPRNFHPDLDLGIATATMQPSPRCPKIRWVIATECIMASGVLHSKVISHLDKGRARDKRERN